MNQRLETVENMQSNNDKDGQKNKSNTKNFHNQYYDKIDKILSYWTRKSHCRHVHRDTLASKCNSFFIPKELLTIITNYAFVTILNSNCKFNHKQLIIPTNAVINKKTKMKSVLLKPDYFDDGRPSSNINIQIKGDLYLLNKLIISTKAGDGEPLGDGGDAGNISVVIEGNLIDLGGSLRLYANGGRAGVESVDGYAPIPSPPTNGKDGDICIDIKKRIIVPADEDGELNDVDHDGRKHDYDCNYKLDIKVSGKKLRVGCHIDDREMIECRSMRPS